MDYKYLLDLAIILLCTKALGLLTRRVQMPQVVGALLAGLLLGPAGVGILTETSFLQSVAEIGVIVLMFCAGMETDIKELKACGLHFVEYWYRLRVDLLRHISSIGRG